MVIVRAALLPHDSMSVQQRSLSVCLSQGACVLSGIAMRTECFMCGCDVLMLCFLEQHAEVRV